MPATTTAASPSRRRRPPGDSSPHGTAQQMTAARDELARQGLWVELSAAAGLAARRTHPAAVDGPTVCIATSSGFKDITTGTHAPEPAADWNTISARIRALHA
ncbi:hypothetical protein [Actinoallomurus sp. NPDC052274]|uniref:hypothetical protein n=1 Tax=Actinoallomurus sp. NPDC052274 TaxID=3155420 RepID=UPI00343B4A00